MLPRDIEKGKYEKESVDYEYSGFSVSFFEDVPEGGIGFIPHMHPEIEFLYIDRGTAEIHCNSGCFQADAGDIFVFNSNEIHSAKPGKDYRSKCIQFDTALLTSKFVDACERKYIRPLLEKNIVFENRYKNDSDLSALFFAIEREFVAEHKGFEIAVKGLLLCFLARLLRANETEENHVYDIENRNLERVNSVIAYIAENHAEKIDFKQLARDMYLGASYFSRVFKSYTGKTMVEYLNHYRITQAVDLLAYSNKTVTQIASLTGFDDLNYFSRTFKKITGVSPLAARRKNKK